MTRNILRDVFLYGDPGSIAVAKMERAEILKFYDHSVTKAGYGAFLQVSESREAVEARTGSIEVALVAYMLTSKRMVINRFWHDPVTLASTLCLKWLS